jgi:signal transduction histidine kinase
MTRAFAEPSGGPARAAARPSAPAVRASTETVQVLVINGGDPYLPAFLAIDGAMRRAMAERRPGPVVWLNESIDTLRLGAAPSPILAEPLARKYAGVRIDAVLLVTESAVDFYLQHRQQLWPQAPALYHFVAPDYAARLPAAAGLSGVPVHVDYAGAVRLALALRPHARRALVVAGVSPFDDVQAAGFRAALDAERKRLAAEFVVGEPLGAAAERLAHLTDDTIVLYASLFRDRDGNVYVPRAALETLGARSAVPIYGVFESQIGHGLTAGAIESLADRGALVADLVRRALAGELAPATVEPPPAARCVADGRRLERFGLTARWLPADCEIRFVEPGFFQRYAWQSVLVGLAFVAQSLLIAALLLQRRRRAAELSLQAQRVQLLHASRLAVAGELTASIAHEINQPLAAILSNAEAAELLLHDGRADRDELLAILSDIRRDDLRASEVIERLRALLARHDTQRRRFDLNGAVEAAAAILRAEARRRHVAVDYDLRARRAEVLGDPVQIQQVLINLVLNALEASAEQPPAARRVRVETRDSATAATLTVRDFGAGIAADDLVRVFDPLFSTKRSGMGLGLTIVRSIVEAHGGTIAAAAAVGPGAEFRVVLPHAPQADTP